ncbi:MAG: MalY/PatB family protein [Pseudomonadota bacterium]
MSFDFDTQLALKGTHSSKYDAIAREFGRDDPEMIPMWVADMDFPAPPPVLKAVQDEIDRGFMGYFTNLKPVAEAVSSWYADRHGWTVDPDCVRFTHGVVNAYGVALATFTDPGDEVIVFSPVYHAFFRQIEAMGRVVVESPLLIQDSVFHMDLAELEASLSGREKVLTLCTPHNPGGRIWSEDELREVASFCRKHDLILISDEIHMDLVFPGARFIPTCTAAPDCVDRLIVLTAASKGFNLAGGETGVMVVPDDALRQRIDVVLVDREATPNRFGMLMMKAAFTEGAEWSDAVRTYLAENFRLFAERIGNLPGVSVMPMNATYLSWVDFTSLGMSDAELIDRMLDANVAPEKGTKFRHGGSGHLRFNVALPRPTLITAIERIEKAFADLQ